MKLKVLRASHNHKLLLKNRIEFLFTQENPAQVNDEKKLVNKKTFFFLMVHGVTLLNCKCEKISKEEKKRDIA
jgi:hypothetical protein